jgi:hypothetical protein
MSGARVLAASEQFSQPTLVAPSPQLWVQDDFLTAAEIADALAFLADEERVTEAAFHLQTDSAGYAAEFLAASEPVLARIAGRIEAALGVRTALETTLRLRHYTAGESHPLHCDRYAVDGCQLAISVMVYLLDTPAGGETAFPEAQPAPIVVEPRAGRVVAWSSVGEDGGDERTSLHEGRVVTDGEKAVLLAFIYLPEGTRPRVELTAQ